MNKYLVARFLLLFILCHSIVWGQQPAFFYKKGKPFSDANTYFVPNPVYLKGKNPTFISSGTIPEQKHTVCFTIALPEYVSGVFFSRDFKDGGEIWPNITNRLLPWSFNKLNDLLSPNYKGIPSNGNPSVIGDYVLLQLKNGRFAFLKAVAGANSLSWFHITTNNKLQVYVSTLGEDFLDSEVPLLSYAEEESVYKLMHNIFEFFTNDARYSTARMRTEKKHFEPFNYLGWCTWEQYHFDINESKLLKDIDLIENSDLPIRYILIDDGHPQSNKEQLSSFTPDSKKFPNAWSTIINKKKEDKIKWMGLWYNFTGYWNGISSENDFPQSIKENLYANQKAMLPGKNNTQINSFYRYYLETIKHDGFDFVKIDNQSFMLPLYMGGTNVIQAARDCNIALEQQAQETGLGLMNCMAQNVLNIDNTKYSSSSRVSIDYKKYNMGMAKSHLFQSYANTLIMGQTVWPDHDMFHSSDSISGALMARSKAISGGPVYLSDSPADFVKENINPLIDAQGKLFKPLVPAVPTPESIFMNPVYGDKAYRVCAPVGDEALAIICYNLSTSSSAITSIKPSDYLLRNELLSTNKIKHAEKIVLYDWKKQTSKILSAENEISLTGFSDKLYFLCPVSMGWGVIGLQNKYLSPATVHIVKRTMDKLVLDVFAPGQLKVWVQKNKKGILRTIEITKKQRIEIKK